MARPTFLSDPSRVPRLDPERVEGLKRSSGSLPVFAGDTPISPEADSARRSSAPAGLKFITVFRFAPCACHPVSADRHLVAKRPGSRSGRPGTSFGQGGSRHGRGTNWYGMLRAPRNADPGRRPGQRGNAERILKGPRLGSRRLRSMEKALETLAAAGAAQKAADGPDGESCYFVYRQGAVRQVCSRNLK